MLGYFMDYHAPGFQAELVAAAQGRIGRWKAMARRLTDLLTRCRSSASRNWRATAPSVGRTLPRR